MDYKVLTSRSVLDIPDSESYDDDIFELYNEQEEEFHNAVSGNETQKDFIVDINGDHNELIDIDDITYEASNRLPLKEGYDIVQFDDGKYGIVAYNGNKESYFKVLRPANYVDVLIWDGDPAVEKYAEDIPSDYPTENGDTVEDIALATLLDLLRNNTQATYENLTDYDLDALLDLSGETFADLCHANNVPDTTEDWYEFLGYLDMADTTPTEIKKDNIDEVGSDIPEGMKEVWISYYSLGDGTQAGASEVVDESEDTLEVARRLLPSGCELADYGSFSWDGEFDI